MKSLCIFFIALFFSPVLTCSFPDLTPKVPATAPANLRLIAGSPPVLAWDAVPGAGAYAVYKSCVCCSWPDACDLETTSTSIAVTDHGYYTVAAESKTGGLVGPRSDTPVLFGAPATPINVTVRASGLQYFLTWQAATCAESYLIYRSLEAMPDPFPTVFAVSTATSFQVFPSVPTYYYWVTALNCMGEESSVQIDAAISF